MNFVIPAVYLPPYGTPLYWGNEQSGVLQAAVLAFYDAAINKMPLATEHLALVRHYLAYVIHAPCWWDGDEGSELTALRAEVHRLSSVEEINRWIMRCLDVGIDPL